MAYIIRDNLEDEFAAAQISIIDGDEKLLKDFFKATRANPHTIGKADWYTGTYIPLDVVQTRLLLTKGEALYDWRTMRGGGVLVSGRFKNCVEELDPGRHQFFPVTVEDNKGGLKPGPFFIFNVVGYIDSIIEEQSNLKASGRGIIEAWGYERRVGPWKCALKTSVIGDRACWTELRWGRVWFVSDRLATLMQQRGLLGFDLTDHCEEVST
jgi:hypothetical protein